MRRIFPKSLAGQTVLLLLIGLSVSHAISMLIYSGDRGEALTLLGGRHMSQRIANIAHLVSGTPAAGRQRIVSAVNDATFKVSLSPESELNENEDASFEAVLIRRYVQGQLKADSVRNVFVLLLDLSERETGQNLPGTTMRMGMQMAQIISGAPLHHAIRVSIQLADGQWVNFSSAVPESDSFWSTASVFSLLSMTAAVILLSIWVVRRLTNPLRAFAAAAERLGKDVQAPPLPNTGPVEVRRAAQAFNGMQDRLRRFVENRTSMLAAISHDLRTPLTRLRLRAELVEVEENRTKMLAALDDMEAMISSTLAFARQDAECEETRTVDISALLESICDDMADTGASVELDTPDKVRLNCRPTAMKRAFVNLIDNAVKYGGNARIQLGIGGEALSVTIEDDGPGIEADKLEQVFQPFFRVEPSRNPETGGAGLGLSVAQTIIHAHGGEIFLANRVPRGLKVTIRLPL